MSPQEARQVIEALARGIDPETGVVLPPDNPLHGPHVIRALFVAAEALAGRGSRPAREQPAQAGKPWPPEEDERLLAGYEAGNAINELARAHERSRGAITSRLVRLGKIESRRDAAQNE